MIRAALLLLLLIPLFDVMVLVVLAREIGAAATVALVVLTAFVGLLLARFVGRRALKRIEKTVRAGEIPTDELLDAGLIFLAGIVFVTPGLVTDLFGLMVLFPLTRRPIRYAVKEWMIVPYLDARAGGMVTGEVYTRGFPGTPSGDPVDIEVDVEDVEEESPGEGNA